LVLQIIITDDQHQQQQQHLDPHSLHLQAAINSTSMLANC
jgi:hypothetical protein